MSVSLLRFGGFSKVKYNTADVHSGMRRTWIFWHSEIQYIYKSNMYKCIRKFIVLQNLSIANNWIV